MRGSEKLVTGIICQRQRSRASEIIQKEDERLIYTVTLNPAIDYIVSAESFMLGGINRYHSESYAPGGKGINVSLALRELEVPTTAVAVAAGFSGEEIRRCLEEKSIATDFIMLSEGHSRVNFKVQSQGDETDLNGVGPKMTEDVIDEIISRLSTAGEQDVIVLAGSLPEGVPDEAYAKIIAGTKHTGASFVVDTVDEALRKTLEHRPLLVKPNLEELCDFCGEEAKTVSEAAELGKRLQKQGAKIVVVSLGEQGALLITSELCEHYEAAKTNVVSTVGAGDSLVAGFLYSYVKDKNLSSAMKWGIAAGAATTAARGIAKAEDIKRIRASID